MFEISDEAMKLIVVRLEEAIEGRPTLRQGSTKVGLRLTFRREVAQLSLAFPRRTDRVMTIAGRPVLIIDPADYLRLEQTRLTVENALSGSKLSLEPIGPEKAA